MSPPQLTPNISLGSILQIGTMILSLGVAWGLMDSRTAALREQTATLDRQIVQMEMRLRLIENSTARNEARTEQQIAAILAAVEEIKRRLDRNDELAYPRKDTP